MVGLVAEDLQISESPEHRPRGDTGSGGGSGSGSGGVSIAIFGVDDDGTGKAFDPLLSPNADFPHAPGASRDS